MSQHIRGIAIVVPDYDSAIAFYCGVLGFDLVADEDQGAGKRWVLVRPPGATETHLLLAKATSPAQLEAIGNQTGGRVFLFLHTDQFETDYADMRAAGVTFEETPRYEDYGAVAVFQDPFGNRWDLLQLNSK